MSAEPAQATPLWLLMALVSKRDGPTLTHSCMTGWRVMQEEEAARGSFQMSIEREKPGFSIDDFQCIEIPEEVMRRALGLDIECQDGISEGKI